MQILHEEAGICHRDIREENVMVVHNEVRLIDFSHASFKTYMAPESWEIRKESDYVMLEGIFAAANARCVRALHLFVILMIY